MICNPVWTFISFLKIRSNDCTGQCNSLHMDESDSFKILIAINPDIINAHTETCVELQYFNG